MVWGASKGDWEEIRIKKAEYNKKDVKNFNNKNVSKMYTSKKPSIMRIKHKLWNL
jgi:hypothetical protein